MSYTKKIADSIIEQIEEGRPLRAICRDAGMPSKSVVYRWLDKEDAAYQADFEGRFARARIAGFDAIADECMDIADDSTNDYMMRRAGDEEVRVLDAEHVNRSRLRIDTRLKLLAKWDPKRYGEKTKIEHDAGGSLLALIEASMAPRVDDSGGR